MNTENISLNDVLESYAFATPDGNDLAVLEQWMTRYPQFSQDLMNFAAERDLLQFDEIEQISPAEEARHLELSRQTLQNFLVSHSEKIESLTALAKKKGLKKQEFAKRLGLTVSLVQYLEKRRLKFVSIPEKIIEKTAEILQLAEEKIAEYLKQPPVSATDANFKNQTRPSEIEQKSFAEAVREDQSLSAEEKQKLLSLIND